MRSLFGTLVMFLVMVLFGAYAWNHVRHATLIAPAIPPKPTSEEAPGPSNDPAGDAPGAVKFVGPLANYMSKQQGSGLTQAIEEIAHMETLAPLKPNPSDLVGNSVVGSTMPIVQSTFRVRAAVQVPFEVPAHAATPRLKGNYQSFVKSGTQSSESDVDVEFIVVNDQQYADFLEKRAGEAVFSAEEAHHQVVNANLPPTLDQPKKYHLIFRNNSKTHEKTFVQADFHMEF